MPDVHNILVTGGEGFIASWLVRHLVVKYPTYNVVSFDKLDYCSSLNHSRLLEGRPNFKFFHGDVTNDMDVLRCLQKYNIDTIFHLAAHTHVDLSFGNSYNFTKNNVLGTHILLESAIAAGTIRRFYHISTDEVSVHPLEEVQKTRAKLADAVQGLRRGGDGRGRPDRAELSVANQSVCGQQSGGRAVCDGIC